MTTFQLPHFCPIAAELAQALPRDSEAFDAHAASCPKCQALVANLVAANRTHRAHDGKRPEAGRPPKMVDAVHLNLMLPASLKQRVNEAKGSQTFAEVIRTALEEWLRHPTDAAK